MTVPVTPRMRLDAVLNSIVAQFGRPLKCGICGEALLPGQKIAFDHANPHAISRDHTYLNIRPVHAERLSPLDCHTKKTSHPRGPHTSVDSDTHAAAKVKRCAVKMAPAKRAPGQSKPPSQWPGRSRPWPKRKMEFRA